MAPEIPENRRFLNTLRASPKSLCWSVAYSPTNTWIVQIEVDGSQEGKGLAVNNKRKKVRAQVGDRARRLRANLHEAPLAVQDLATQAPTPQAALFFTALVLIFPHFRGVEAEGPEIEGNEIASAILFTVTLFYLHHVVLSVPSTFPFQFALPAGLRELVLRNRPLPVVEVRDLRAERGPGGASERVLQGCQSVVGGTDGVLLRFRSCFVGFRDWRTTDKKNTAVTTEMVELQHPTLRSVTCRSSLLTTSAKCRH